MQITIVPPCSDALVQTVFSLLHCWNDLLVHLPTLGTFSLSLPLPLHHSKLIKFQSWSYLSCDMTSEALTTCRGKFACINLTYQASHSSQLTFISHSWRFPGLQLHSHWPLRMQNRFPSLCPCDFCSSFRIQPKCPHPLSQTLPKLSSEHLQHPSNLACTF